MWTDNETTEDLLGFNIHAELITSIINGNNMLPVTIGVFGDWGSGKSSILQIIKNKLDSDPKTLCIYFNGWTFEGYDDAKAALLNAILQELETSEKLSSQLVGSVKEKAKKVWKSINWMRGAGLVMKNVALPAISAYFTGGVSLLPFALQKLSEWGAKDPSELITKLQTEEGQSLLKSLQNEVNSEKEERITMVSKFRDDFEDLLKSTNFEKLVVIIDDLDRCTPDRIIENLEAIKLFLNVPGSAFVIGADPRIVRHAIEFKYKTDKIAYSDDEKNRNERIVSDYLEKLIQIPYNLPKLSDHEVETYLTMLFCKKELGESFGTVLASYQDHISKDRHSVFGLGDITPLLTQPERDSLGKSISLLVSSSKIITDGLKGNPRQIKRFLNTYTLRSKLIEIARFGDIRMDILAKLMVLEYSNIDLFRELYSWQSRAQRRGEPEEIVKLETLAAAFNKDEISKMGSVNWSKDETINWLNSEPKLSRIDLRDYYWVSRDQLSDSISASSMISKEIRDLRKELFDYSSDRELRRILTSRVIGLSESDLKTLLGLFEKEMLREPSEERLHMILIVMSEMKVQFTVEVYVKLLTQIDNNVIPYHLSNNLKSSLSKNQDIKKIIDQLLKQPASKISKSLKN